MAGKNSWKQRGTYGILLKKKIVKLNEFFWAEAQKDKPDFEKMSKLSKDLDYSIQVQLSNINKIEEFEMLERMETIDGQRTTKVPQMEITADTSSQYKFK